MNTHASDYILFMKPKIGRDLYSTKTNAIISENRIGVHFVVDNREIEIEIWNSYAYF